MTRVLVGCTIPSFKMEDDGHWWHWLEHAQEVTTRCAAEGIEVSWLAVCQHDARGRGRFMQLLTRMDALDAVDVWTRFFSLDPPGPEWESGTRLQAICTGRNLVIDHALRNGHEWIHFADSDVDVNPETLPALLALDWPVCAAHVPTYCLDGPDALEAWEGEPETLEAWREDNSRRLAGADVRAHWNTAGSLLVHRNVFRFVPWRWDPDAGLTDDPATQTEMAARGWPTLVRHDVVCEHWPQTIGPLEGRGHDLAAY